MLPPANQGWYVPVGHDMHDSKVVAPIMLWYAPAGQGKQAWSEIMPGAV